jgi:hypothetical protein
MDTPPYPARVAEELRRPGEEIREIVTDVSAAGGDPVGWTDGFARGYAEAQADAHVAAFLLGFAGGAFTVIAVLCLSWTVRLLVGPG